MTEQEQKAFDQMRQALIDIKYGLEGARIWGGMDWTYNPLHPFKYLPLRDRAEQALTAANAVSHPKPETTPPPEGGAITSESAANAVSHPQATEPAGCKRDPLDLGQYVNEAHISANDRPIAVIRKLQAVINERNAHHE